MSSKTLAGNYSFFIVMNLPFAFLAAFPPMSMDVSSKTGFSFSFLAVAKRHRSKAHSRSRLMDSLIGNCLCRKAFFAHGHTDKQYSPWVWQSEVAGLFVKRGVP